jgi:hypothetical protein
LHCHDFHLPSILAGRFNEGDYVILKREGQRATLIDDGGHPVVVEIEGERKLSTINLKVKDDNGKVYTDPLAWKLGKQGRWARSDWKDHWRTIQHTDTRHPDNSKYRTLRLGNVKVLRNATDNLLTGRCSGSGGGGGVGSTGSSSNGGAGGVERHGTMGQGSMRAGRGEQKKRKRGENKNRG